MMAPNTCVLVFLLGARSTLADIVEARLTALPAWRPSFRQALSLDVPRCATSDAVVLLQSGIEQHPSHVHGGLETASRSEPDFAINEETFWPEQDSKSLASGSRWPIALPGNSSKLFYRGHGATAIMPLANAMHKLELGGTVCLTIRGKGVGGVANTVSLFNTAMDFTNAENLRFAMPSLFVPAHGIGSSFENLFGEIRNCSSPVQLFEAFCNRAVGRTYKNGKVRCGMDGFLLDMSSSSMQTSRTCGCEKVVVLDTTAIDYHFNYSRTKSKLSSLYWGAHKSLARLPSTEILAPGYRRHGALSIVVHVRLGDVAVKGFSEKHKAPSLYVHVMQALFQRFGNRTDCLHASIVTDGKKDHQDIAAILSGLASAGLPTPMVYDVDTVDAVTAFEIMTHADVLVCGGSGFSRLAAVLLRDTSIVLGNEMRSHPLGYLRNFVEIPHGLGGGDDVETSNLTVSSVLESFQGRNIIDAVEKKVSECEIYQKSQIDLAMTIGELKR